MKYSRSDLLELASEAGVKALTSDLQSITRESQDGWAIIVLATPKRSFHILAEGATGGAKTHWLDIGCASKLLTVMALFRDFSHTDQFLCDRIGKHLNLHLAGWLSEISVAQLLNHTHGIDEPSDWELPTSANGMIDVPSILRRVGPEPLSSSTEIYSYSSVGPWLLAAILEAKAGRPFIEVIRSAFPGLLPPHTEGKMLCPANGSGVEINAIELLRQMVQLTSKPSTAGIAHIDLGSAQIQKHPGWHPTELGIAFGWKAYGDDWYGHQSVLHGRSDLNVRVSPTTGLGVLVSSVGGQQAKILQSMFDETVFGPIIQPSGLLKKGDIPPPPCFEARGVYRRIDSCLEVSSRSDRLEIRVTSGASGSPSDDLGAAALKPIGKNAYLVSPPVRSLNLYIVEFVRNKTSEVTHLWSAGRVWRREGENAKG